MDAQSRSIPTLFEAKEYCCGCSACFCICACNAITMREDEEGFVYPMINESLCVRCEQCIKVCPIKTKKCQPETSR